MLTRTIKLVCTLMDSQHPPKEVLKALEDDKMAHVNLAAKHEESTMSLTNEDYGEADICAGQSTRCGTAVMICGKCRKAKESCIHC